MGVVWLALDERLQRPVAVKQMWPGAGFGQAGDEARQRIMREGRIAARLRHPNAIIVHDVAEHNGQPLLVMEYLPSRSLATVLAEQGTLAPETVARIGAQAGSALAAAHAAGIVHRDLKPGNLLVGDDGTVKIADFGISRATGDIAVTRADVVAGTPAYLAPEIARGHQPSADSDVFSLGSTLYAAVEGIPPFGEDTGNSLAVLHRVAAADVPPPRQAGPLTPVLTAMLRPDPAQRPSAVQVTRALEAVAEGHPIDPTSLDPAAGVTQPVVAPSSPTVAVTPLRGTSGTRLDTRPVAPPPATGWSRWWTARRRFLLPALAVVAAAVAATILFTQLSLTPRPGAAAPPPAATKTADPAALNQAVSDYYRLLPADTATAWTRLGPALQAQGMTAYRTYWSTVTRLTVTTPPEVAGTDTVSIGLQLVLTDGTTMGESHLLGLLATDDGTLLINSDTVLNSTTSSPPAPQTPPPSAAASAPGHDQPGKKGGKPGKHGSG
jgi:Protein kinase domain